MVWEEKLTIDGLPYYYDEAAGTITWDKPEALMTKLELEEERGDWFWIPDPEKKKLWVPARVSPDDERLVSTREGREYPMPDFSDTPKWPVKLSQLNRPVEDLVQQDQINDASIINNIRLRYEKNQLYTWVGAARSVLISVNPYKMINLYSSKHVDLYRNKPPNTHLDPHVFDIANDSYNSLLFTNASQSILISGESGAGKTFATKQCLEFMAQVAGSDDSEIEERILLANPLLEAFGNAQTIRNNNSSRFGKWIEVSFKNRKIHSATILNYLLEKSRLVTQQKGERNYHIFYQMASQGECGLKSPENYEFLNKTGVYKAHLIDDNEDFVKVKEALNLLKFSPEEQDFVLNLTAGILTLGNLIFVDENLKDGVTGSKITNEAELEAAAKYMGFSAEDLSKVLRFRTIKVRNQTNTIPLDKKLAKSATDSFAMGLYSRLFNFLVMKINISLKGEGTGGKRFVGILDIFGFEIFEQNSFEQLLINFANEKLQQQFNRTTFKEEEELYRSEGIKYEHVEFIDNQIVLELIEKKHKGILPMLDDECKLPEGSDVKFMNKVESNYQAHPKFQTDTQRKLKDSFNFEVIHYAGVVQYNGENFMQKNTDNLYPDMLALCSSTASVSTIFTGDDSGAMGNSKSRSISFQFRGQLNELMEKLYATESRYIRCAKPNNDQRPDRFDSHLVIDQLRYSGVFEAVEIRKRGYPFRYGYAPFAARYGCINRLKSFHRYSNKNDHQLCEEILETSSQDFSGCVFGNSMVFFKTNEYSTLELLRNLSLERLIPLMQACMRGGLARSFYLNCKKLDKKIVKALRKGNDLDALSKSLAAVKPALEVSWTLDQFHGVLPWHYAEGQVHEKKLKKWKKVEGKLQDLLSKEPNKKSVFDKLRKVLDDIEELEKENIPKTDSQVALVKQAKSAIANSVFGKIDKEAKTHYGRMDIQEMEIVLKKARELEHSNLILDKIASILSLSEKEIVMLELEKAKEMGDKERQIHRECRLGELELLQNEKSFSKINDFSGLRDPMEYGKSTLFGKLLGVGVQKNAEGMLLFSKTPALTSLLQFTASDPKAEKLAKKNVKSMSNAIKMFMQDKPPKPADASEEVLAVQIYDLTKAIMQTDKNLVSEPFFQIMKQLQPSEKGQTANETKGFNLLGLLLGYLMAPEEVVNRVLIFAKQKQRKEWKQYQSMYHENKYGSRGEKPLTVEKAKAGLSSLQEGNVRSRYSVAAGERTGPSAGF